MNRDFKGIWIPKSLIKIAGCRLALRLCAFYLKLENLSREDYLSALDLGLIEERKLTNLEIKETLRSKKPQNIFSDISMIETCQWCEGTTIILHSHHYPIPKCQGGKATVSICPNCHAEYLYRS